MTLGQLDDVLKSWKARLSAIAENLLELQTDATYQSLTGTGGLDRVTITGLTAERVSLALRTVNELFLRFGLLQSTVDRAEEIRKGLPAMFGAEPRLRELHKLLFTPSIELQASEVPLADRHLLSGMKQAERISPEELLDSMTRTFAEVRDAVSAVGEAWTEYGTSYDRMDVEIARLRCQTAMPSRLMAPALDALEASLKGLQEQVPGDPMGALVALRVRVEPGLATANQRVIAAEQMGRSLRAAGARWRAMEGLHREATGVVAEAKARLTAAEGRCELVPEAKLQALGEWLGRLERKCDDGALEAVGIGLQNWSAAAESCAAQDQAALAACEARLASRGELRGRLEALKAKVRSCGLTADGDLCSLSQGAEALLYAHPLDLRLAGAALARFEQRLRAASLPSDAVRGAGSR